MKTILCAILCFCIIAAASAAAIVGGAASKLDGETVPTQSPTSYVKGKVFDRFVIIWLENTDYSMAAGDREYFARFLYVAPLICTSKPSVAGTEGCSA